jgi:gamma-glutamylaminecyclotransferase
MPTRVFVYGTLRGGEANHHLLATATFVRDARTPPAFTLYAFEGHPGMGDGGTSAIVGECFDVDEATLAMLDELEDHPRWYQRRSLALEDGEVVLAYVLPPHFTEGRAVIPGGDWVHWRRGA